MYSFESDSDSENDDKNDEDDAEADDGIADEMEKALLAEADSSSSSDESDDPAADIDPTMVMIDRQHHHPNRTSTTNTTTATDDRNDVDIKGYGQRARERLEQQKQNRREIKVLDHLPQPPDPSRRRPPPQRKPPPKPVPAAMATEAAPFARKRKQFNDSNAHNKRPSKTMKRSTEDNQYDPLVVWKPDTSSIIQPKSTTKDIDQQQQSTWVVLHGLPRQCTPTDVRRFFVGLQTQMICVLLSNNARMKHILDTSNDPPPPTPQSDGVCIITSARVIVKFDSVGIAVLATERSGETLSMVESSSFSKSSPLSPNSDSYLLDEQDNDKDNESGLPHGNDDEDDGPTKKSSSSISRNFAIGVTLLTKTISKILVQNVAVDIKKIRITEPTDKDSNSNITTTASQKKSYTFDEYVAIVEQNLPTLAREVLWTFAATQQCSSNNNNNGIILDDDARKAKLYMDFDHRPGDANVDKSNDSLDDITTLTGYQSLAGQYNRIVDIVERLTEWVCSKDHGGSIGIAETIRLTNRACRCLELELDRLGNLAQQARVVRRLNKAAKTVSNNNDT
jgi:hypothetical protein